MKPDHGPYEAYVHAIREKMERHLDALNDHCVQQSTGPLSFKDRNSVARSLQVMVDIAIACSKHYLNSQQKPIFSEPSATVERVYELLTITSPDIHSMRNAIIHDYLNLDWARI